jgi:hypothetical protein
VLLRAHHPGGKRPDEREHFVPNYGAKNKVIKLNFKGASVAIEVVL